MCEICGGEGTYPIYSAKGSYAYDITCPECLGVSDAAIEAKCSKDRAALEEFLARPDPERQGGRNG